MAGRLIRRENVEAAAEQITFKTVDFFFPNHACDVSC